MRHRDDFLRLLAVALMLASTAAAVRADDDDDDDDGARMELDLLFGYNKLQGDAADAFDDGGYGGLAFEYAFNEPHDKRTFRAFAARVTVGYLGNDGTFQNTKLKGTVIGLDGMILVNVTKVVKPYGFLGFGNANVHDDNDLISGGSGVGFDFGVGSKFFFGDHFVAVAEMSNQSFQVQGDQPGSPSQFGFFQVRFGAGFRF